MKGKLMLVVVFGLFAVGARAQTTNNSQCHKVGEDDISCTSTTDVQAPDALPPGASGRGAAIQAGYDAEQKRQAQVQAATVAQQNAEANCVGGGGAFYEGHCLTQQQYAEKKKREADWASQQEQARIAKQAKKAAEKAAKEAKKGRP